MRGPGTRGQLVAGMAQIVDATFLGIAPSTIRAYAARGQMPEADRRIGCEPVWRPATIRRWHSQRPRHARSAAQSG